MAKKSSNIQVNGRILKVTTELEDGSYSVTYKGEEIGTGNAQSGGGFIIKSNAATREVLSNAEGGVDALQPKLYGAIENENKAIINKNASTTQKLNLRDLGYGNKLDIPGVTTPPAPEQDQTPAPKPGNGEDQSPPEATEEKPPAQQDLGGGSVRYPIDVIDGNQDHVLFSIVEYVPLTDVSTLVAGTAGRPSGRIKRENPVGTIILPMPRNLQDGNSVNWGPDQMNALQAAGAGLIQGFLGEGVDGMQTAIDNIKAGLSGSSNQIKDYISAETASQITGGGNILARTTGSVLNSNLELLFSGPALRTFNFTYKFTPREAAETAACKDIIRKFKKAMAARLKGSAIFLHTPHVFFIDFFHRGQDHPFLNRIKPCALLNFGVSYTPDGAYATYEDGSPVAYELQFSFQELEPIYDKDYEDGEGAKGMGF